jgi:hypothetical protein
MHKVMNETTLRMRGLISRRMFSQAWIVALSAKLLPRITFGFATADAAAPSSAHGRPTLDEPGTGWLDCGLLAQMLFGYRPKFGGTPELLNADTPRGFTGELRHVCCAAQRYTIQSRETGLMLEIES